MSEENEALEAEQDVNAESSPAEETQGQSTEQDVKDETKPEASGEPEGKKDELPAGVKKRFGELTRDKYQLKEELKQRDEVIAELEKRNQPQEPVKPKYSDYDTDGDYEAAMDNYVAQKSEHEARLKESQNLVRQRLHALQQQRAQNQQKYFDNLKEQESLFDDFQGKLNDPIAAAVINQMSPEVVDIIWSSEKGPALSYHLATHIDEAEDIASLPPLQASYRLAQIESRLEIPQPKTVSNAPEPIKPVDEKATFDKAPVDMSQDEHDKWRAKRKAARRA